MSEEGRLQKEREEGRLEGRKQLAEECLGIFNSHGSGRLVKQLVYDEILERLQKEVSKK